MCEIIMPDISDLISIDACKYYDELNVFFQNVFLLIKIRKIEDLQDEFSDKYYAFARQLKKEGYVKETHYYMSICEMIHDSMNGSDVLKSHHEFFNNLFNSFGELLFVKINSPDEFEEKYQDCIYYLDDCEFYFYTKVAIPSPNYDKAVCEEILSHLNGGLY